MSNLQALAKQFHWFTTHPSLGKEAFSDMLKLQHDILPEGNLLPSGYADAMKII